MAARPFASGARTDWVLVTGQPGCGKTTAVKALADALRRDGAKLRGFYTDEVRGGGGRVGFDVVTVPNGDRGVLSRKGRDGPKCGQYGVDVEAFEALALPTLADADEPEIYVLDEIGRMELKSAAFAARVEALLKRGVRLVGAITAPIYGHRVPFCDRVAATPGVRVVKLTGKTRDAATAELRADVVARWAPGGPAKKRRREV
mmetsp:Transcript_5704/g.16845  ORF Transcript_5704/g.16845 Transcript_5704/m.16845 type:complete len:203 (-) Transcript_5704:26-634(-)